MDDDDYSFGFLAKRRSAKRRTTKRRSTKRRTTKRRTTKRRRGSKRGNTAVLRKWIRAARKHGYMVKGNFKRVPRRGTSAYKKIKKTYDNM